MNKLTLPTLFISLMFIFPAATFAAGGGGSDGDSGSSARPRVSPLAPYQELISKEQYSSAIRDLNAAILESPKNADLINLLAYSHRKLGEFGTALEYYQAALEIDPSHRGANEYLGELYLQTGQLAKAQERLQKLDKLCFFPCEEYTDLKKAIKAYQQSHAS